MEGSPGLQTRLAHRVKMQLAMSHSSILPVPSGQIDESVQRIASIATAAGFTPVVVSTSTPRIQLSRDPSHELVFVVPLHESITEGIARSLKYLADEFSDRRVGNALPNGQVIEEPIRIRCSYVVPSCQEFRNWPLPLLRSFIDNYSFWEFCA